MATPPVWPGSAPPASAGVTRPPARRPRYGLWIAGGTAVLTIAAAATGAAATGAAATYVLAVKDPAPSSSAVSSSSTPTPTRASQSAPADAAQAKENLCQQFKGSAGQKGQGGFRVDGNLNIPVTLQAVTSVVAVEHSLVSSVPAGLATAAQKYISSTLNTVTAAMGTTSIDEINQLTQVSNAAAADLSDVCGLPR